MSADPKTVLAIDTTMNGCGVCVYDGVQKTALSQAVYEQAYGQAEHLVPLMQDVIAQAGLSFSQIGLIGVTHGPGSFTGLRTGLTTAKMLSVSLNIPIFGVSSLLALALSCLKKQKIEASQNLVSCIDTRRGDFYVQSFDSQGKSVSDPMIKTAQDLMALSQDKDVIFVGEFSNSETMSTPYARPESDVVAQLALDLVGAQASMQEYGSVQPLYLRDAEIGVSKTPRRKLAL